MMSKRTFIILLISFVTLSIIGVVMYFGMEVTHEVKDIKVGDMYLREQLF